MLFAVEGGGFFSSSATGYSKGLTLLLFGKRKKDKPKRVLPWNQYHLVDQETHINPQLASTKKPLFRRCTSFVCFNCTAAGVDDSFSPKNDSSQSGTRLETRVTDGDESFSTILVRNNLKSSLKKPSKNNSASGEEYENNSHGQTVERRVQWKDGYGSELVEIQEFEPSEVGDSDDDIESGGIRHCSCVIM